MSVEVCSQVSDVKPRSSLEIFLVSQCPSHTFPELGTDADNSILWCKSRLHLMRAGHQACEERSGIYNVSHRANFGGGDRIPDLDVSTCPLGATPLQRGLWTPWFKPIEILQRGINSHHDSSSNGYRRVNELKSSTQSPNIIVSMPFKLESSSIRGRMASRVSGFRRESHSILNVK